MSRIESCTLWRSKIQRGLQLAGRVATKKEDDHGGGGARTSMKAYRIHAAKGIESLVVDDLPSPEPGVGEVLVRVRAVSLNYRDLMVVKGFYSKNLPLPLIPCSDGAGEVAAVGPGVTVFKVGDRVASCFFSGWDAGPLTDTAGKTALGGAVDGMLAEERVLPATGLVAVPGHLSYDQAATLPCAGLTAWNGLIESGGLKPGESVLVQGTGGVSLFALQFARMAGAEVIATSSSEDKLERVRALGASAGINYKTTPEWGATARELAGGLGVDHVVEVGGAGTLGQSLKAVKVGGHIAMIGVLSGAGEAGTTPILMKNVRVQGIYVGSRLMFEAMNRAIALNRLEPIIDRVFSFDQAREAYAHLESARHFGKVVIRVG
jgi:NADPH:quinone reductase-like Zn-dependent oxidoreductase